MIKEVVFYSKSVEKDTRIVQISDCHLIVPDEKDGKLYAKEIERKDFFEREAEWRTGVRCKAEEEMQKAVDYALEQRADSVVFTGDIVEFPTEANLRSATSQMERVPYIYTFGNHDYLDWLSTTPHDEQQRKNLPLFQKYIKNDLSFVHKEINGVNIVALDNSLYFFTEEQADKLEKIAKEKDNILLFFHTPLYTKRIFDVGMEDEKLHVASGMICYEGLEGQYPLTGSTKRFLSILQTYSDKILGIFAGHNHFYGEDKWFGIPEYVCSPTYLGEKCEGTVVDIKIVKK